MARPHIHPYAAEVTAAMSIFVNDAAPLKADHIAHNVVDAAMLGTADMPRLDSAALQALP